MVTAGTIDLNLTFYLAAANIDDASTCYIQTSSALAVGVSVVAVSLKN
jgi:hypothetical protein